mmetsp:Transcript_23510/g.55713  ORF Transcript_23510/g.55713 Transcript_23510/m.55713 type:complete len:378 (-) Transcript_23510:12-1145(-)
MGGRSGGGGSTTVNCCPTRLIVSTVFMLSLLWCLQGIIENEKLRIGKHFVSSDNTVEKSKKLTPNDHHDHHDDDDDDIDWDDPIFNFTEYEWDISPIVLPSHKLMFFTVPKVACTVFKQLFRRMKGLPGWQRDDRIQPHDVMRNRLNYLGRITNRTKQREYLTSPAWTRVIFVRDPLERLLSAYLDKAIGTNTGGLDIPGEYIKIKCCNMKKDLLDLKQERQRLIDHDLQHCLFLMPYEKPMNETTFSFETFVRKFATKCDNEHWRPQSRRISTKNWKFINYVGHFETLQDDTKRMLERIGAYNKYGQNGWGIHGNESIFQQNSASHATKSNVKMKRYYGQLPSDVKSMIEEYYQNDYDHPILRLSPPHRRRSANQI